MVGTTTRPSPPQAAPAPPPAREPRAWRPAAPRARGHRRHEQHDSDAGSDSENGEAQAPTGPDSEVPGSRAGARPGCRLGRKPWHGQGDDCRHLHDALRSSRTAQPRKARLVGPRQLERLPQAAAGGAPCWSAEAAARARGPQPPWRDDWRARCSRARGHRSGRSGPRLPRRRRRWCPSPARRSRPAHPVRPAPPLGPLALPHGTPRPGHPPGWPRPQPTAGPRAPATAAPTVRGQ